MLRRVYLLRDATSKSIGGGMRQAGVISSAGLYAMKHQFDRLAEDHIYAQAFAYGISSIPGIEIDPNAVETNIVFFRLTSDAKLDATTLAQKLEAEKGLLVETKTACAQYPIYTFLVAILTTTYRQSARCLAKTVATECRSCMIEITSFGYRHLTRYVLPVYLR
ncbi:hypothetical protein DD237_002328 [Peronospora effusa]|uniref:Aromatic amino acid beta-eliminating lyase/threonine aldolase domain-containing protein n=1 Tax=Peronospora effusa TaxID=542832 RepID=A0A425BZU8_9STRA|nr:hypothetical protein DD237_002328 [Peronospora effusa]